MRALFLIALFAVLTIVILSTSAPLAAQQGPRDFTVGPPPLDRPLIFDSTTRGSGGTRIPGPRFRVVPLRGFNYPYALAFLPDGGILVTERGGRLRIVRDGKLDPEPIADVPEVLDTRQRGMNDLALHPQFAENHWIYFTYYKPVGGTTNARATLARARYEGGHALKDVRDIFSTNVAVSGPSAAKIVFGRDGKIYMAIGIPIPRAANETTSATVIDAQDPNSYYGKVLRLQDDGSASADNPFSGRPGYKRSFMRWAFGMRWVFTSIRRPANFGKPRMGLKAATKSTSSKPEETTAGP
jgi:glucose/arabinose dehydrogenase